MDTQKLNIFNLLGNSFVSSRGGVKLEAITKYPLIGILFSAEWCPPCQGFGPILINFYKEVNKTKKEMEIVLCSSDKDEASFKAHLESLPWPAIPYDSDAQNDLYDQFEVVGVPVLVVINNKGDVIDAKARNTIQKLGVGSIEFWLQETKNI